MKNKLLIMNIGLSFLMSVGGIAKAAFAPPVRKVGASTRNVKNYGALGDGKHDDTDAFQNAINSLPDTGGTVNVPPGTYLIDALKSVYLRSYMHFNMAPNAVLKTKTNGSDVSAVLFALQVHDVEISGGQIIGDRDTHTGTTGEQGHAVRIRGSQRVTVRDIKVSKNWGDGVCIGAFKQKPIALSDDVVLYNVISTANRRQGLSVGNATNVKVYNSEFSYTQGTSPQFGIDLEPDNFSSDGVDYHYDRNIEIINCNIHHNQGGGIQFFHKVYNSQIRNNNISYNGTGIYAMEAIDAVVRHNTFAHNRHMGVSLLTGTTGVELSYNVFRNNNTNTKGFTNDTNPLVEVIGQLFGTTSSELNVSPDAGTNSILSNKYAK